MVIKTLLTFSLIASANSTVNYSENYSKTTDKNSNRIITQISTTRQRYTGIVKQVDDIAEQITVRIDNLNKNVNGSGVIIAKQGNTYYGLTAKHVLCTIPSVIKPECEPNGSHQIVTNDGMTHQLDYQNVEANGAWLDLAIFSFESNNNYSVATIGAYDPSNSWISVSGFPKQNAGSDGKPVRLITGGILWSNELEDLIVKETGSLSQSKAQEQNGLVYTNISHAGMSGGAVLDSRGRLIGINTGSENELYFDEAGNYDEYSLGFSLGEAVTDFIGYLEANQTDLQEAWLNVRQEPAKNLSKNEINSIETQLLTAEQPGDDTDLAAWMNYGNQLWRYLRFNEAVAAFDKVIAIDPDFDKAYYAKGLAYLYLGEWQQAITALLKATQINPNLYYYWRWLGTSYSQLEQYDRAIFAYDKALEKNQNEGTKDFVLYLERADALGKNQNYAEAITSYNEAIKINPQHPWIYDNRGNIYYLLQQHELAIVDYTKAIELNPNYTDAYYNRGTTYYDLQQYEQALADYTKAIEINPNYAEAYNNRGILYSDLEQHELALTDYTKAIEINPNYAEAYYNRGLTYTDLEQYEPALADYTKAIELNWQDAEAYYNRGNTYKDLEQYEPALADHTKAIEINPNYAPAYLGLGVVYIQIENIEEAKINLEKAQQLYISQDNLAGAESITNLLKLLP